VDYGRFSVRPSQIVASGDGSRIIAGSAAWIGRNPDPKQPGSQFGRIAWTTWTASKADGIGVVWTDNCEPDCAVGTYYPLPVKLLATHVRNGVYTQLVLTSLIPVDGRKSTVRLTLTHLTGTPGYTWE